MVIDYNHLLQQCTNGVHPVIMHGIISQESSFNPFAIGVVNGRLPRQPQTHAEGVAAIRSLEARGMNFSVGLAQVNKQHFRRFGFNAETIFEPCANVKAGAIIYQECYAAAERRFGKNQHAIGAALSCYYSGNFQTGFRRFGNDKLPYVTAVTNRMLTYNNRPAQIGTGIRYAASVFQAGENPITTIRRQQAALQSGASAPVALAQTQDHPVQQPTPFVTGSRHLTNLATNETNQRQEQRKSSLLF